MTCQSWLIINHNQIVGETFNDLSSIMNFISINHSQTVEGNLIKLNA